ncbi:hypothetical protein [Larkinella knui]|uniref:Uncharacterized protein n=1 Tax=Larkinella knui TaxID=2025310 RepID=A0A3P1CXM9_9BACT|nr:hypothetical protein [Larkinella knui]RRB17836.1 hypothetical protein EHT87_06035 [Larkinella knui]
MKLTETDWRIIRLFYAEGDKRPQHLFSLLDDNVSYAKYQSHADKARMPVAIDTMLYNKISSIQVLINRNLKELAKRANIDEVVTFHTAINVR